MTVKGRTSSWVSYVKIGHIRPTRTLPYESQPTEVVEEKEERALDQKMEKKKRTIDKASRKKNK